MKELPQSLQEEVIRRLVSALHPLGIYLFGSHARGSANEDSDVDLLVVVPDTETSTRELARLARRSLWGLKLPVDLLVCTESEMAQWSQVGCNLLHTVAQEGRVVYALNR